MSESTPTTGDMRTAWMDRRQHRDSDREFDYWLAGHDRQVAIQTLRDAADDLRGRRIDAPSEWAEDVLRAWAGVQK